MEKLFYFFDMEYEEVRNPPDLPFRLLLVSVAYVGPHWHPQTEVLFLLSGSVRVGNSRGSWRLDAGDIMVIGANELHDLVEISDNVILVIQYQPDDLDTPVGSDRHWVLLPPEQKVDGAVLERLRSAAARMALEQWDRRPGYSAACRSALFDFLSTAERHLPSEGNDEERLRSPDSRDRLRAVMNHLHRNYADRISLEEVAGIMNVSPSYASHLIRKGTGRTFQENLNFIRTGRAVALMMNSDRTLLDIAVNVGFSDPKYFNRYCRRLFGVTPKQIARKPDTVRAVLSHFGSDGLDPSLGRTLLSRYRPDNGLPAAAGTTSAEATPAPGESTAPEAAAESTG